MKIKLEDFKGNINALMRNLGYHPDRFSDKKEPSFSRPIRGNKFPRFHIYYKKNKNILNLHLDQKAPRYKGASDHGAEYGGELVEKEAKRIKSYVHN
ncbi:MAG: hypothetical protein ACQEP3_00385 [Patescibacteria group bacterium]